MLPDLDSDSGVPVREMFNLAAVFFPLMFLRGLMKSGLEPEEEILVVVGSACTSASATARPTSSNG